MMTLTRTRRPDERSVERGSGDRTPFGTALQVAWVAFVAYSMVMSATQADHPEPPGWAVPLLGFAAAIVGLTLHPASWQMHAR